MVAAVVGRVNLDSEEFGLDGKAFRYISCELPSWTSVQGPPAPIPTRTKASCICSSSGWAVNQTAALHRGGIIAQCAQGAAGQPLKDLIDC